MSSPQRPAVYLRDGTGVRVPVMVTVARQRGWPEPEIYAAGTGPGETAIAELSSALAAGRHDSLLMTVPDLADPAEMRLLRACTRLGVSVSFVPDPADHLTVTAEAANAGEPEGTLTSAGVEALTGLFPRWRIWADRRGWHARRRDGHLQMFAPGAPAFHVRADTATDLAAQLCWQHAADDHAPQGCAMGRT
jgi:hypothetical protein